MARGIWKNSLLKIFLTRSFLGPLFRPLLYSQEEYIHYSFVAPFAPLANSIVKMRESRIKVIAYYWLVDVPRTIFEELFFLMEQMMLFVIFLPMHSELMGKALPI